MRIVVTGGCGFIGSAFIRFAMRRSGVHVLNIDKLTYAASQEAVADASDSRHYSFLQADICDGRRLDNAFDAFEPDAIIHLAAESHVDRSIEGPGAFIETNLIGTYALLEAVKRYLTKCPRAKRDTFRFLHVSTDEVFGSLELDSPSFTEASPYSPRSPYAASKAGSDHLARAWCETYGLPIIVSNCSNNFGPWQFPEKLIPLMITNACQQQALPVYGAGLNIRDWLYVEDHAHALWCILEKGCVGDSYNIGGDSELRNIDVVRTICELMDTRFPERQSHEHLIRFTLDRPGHDLRYSVDARKIRQELGWQPENDFESGLSATLDWYLANEDWWRAIRRKTYDGRRLGSSLAVLHSAGTKQAGQACG